MEHKLDLSRKVCHLCGGQLERDFNCEQEWCQNASCVAHNIRFNVPYQTLEKKPATVKEVLVRRATNSQKWKYRGCKK